MSQSPTSPTKVRIGEWLWTPEPATLPRPRAELAPTDALPTLPGALSPLRPAPSSTASTVEIEALAETDERAADTPTTLPDLSISFDVEDTELLPTEVRVAPQPWPSQIAAPGLPSLPRLLAASTPSPSHAPRVDANPVRPARAAPGWIRFGLAIVAGAIVGVAIPTLVLLVCRAIHL